jgi:hypothetical protein
MLGQDALDRVAAELVTEVAERPADPRVTPSRILGGEPDDEALQRGGGARSAAGALGRAVVLLRDELAIPAQDRVGRDHAGELFQDLAAEDSTLHCEPAALRIREARTSTAELLAQHAVLLLKVREDLDLAPVHPAREHEQQELQRRGRDGRPIPPHAGAVRLSRRGIADPQTLILSRDSVDRTVAQDEVR